MSVLTTPAPATATQAPATQAPATQATAPARDTGPAVAGRRRPVNRLALAALVAGAALNTAEAVLTTAFTSRSDDVATKLAEASENSAGVLALVLSGTFAVPLMLVGLLAVARSLRPAMPRLAATAGGLVFAGCFGFFGMHALSMTTYAAAQLDDRAAAVTVLEGVVEHPIGLVLLVPFLLGLFPGFLLLTVGLLRTRLVSRWIPLVWLVFLVLDLTAPTATPVDPHWLWLAGAVGLAVELGRTRPGAGAGPAAGPAARNA